jgi:hypothetical protein
LPPTVRSQATPPDFTSTAAFLSGIETVKRWPWRTSPHSVASEFGPSSPTGLVMFWGSALNGALASCGRDSPGFVGAFAGGGAGGRTLLTAFAGGRTEDCAQAASTTMPSCAAEPTKTRTARPSAHSPISSPRRLSLMLWTPKKAREDSHERCWPS